MACSNCDALKAEVLSQRELMTEWFQTLMNEIRDSKAELVELIKANTFNVIYEQQKNTHQPLTVQQSSNNQPKTIDQLLTGQESSIAEPISASALLESINSPLQYGGFGSDSNPVSLPLEPTQNPETEPAPDPAIRKQEISAEIEPAAEEMPFEFSSTQNKHTDEDEPLDEQAKASSALKQFTSVGWESFSAIVKNEPIETEPVDREQRFLLQKVQKVLQKVQKSGSQQPQNRRRIYRCSKCPYEAFTQSSIQKHSLIHSGQKKPFSCDQCAFSTYTRSGLIRHQSVHTGEKPFACDHCDFRTSRKITLQDHQRIHTGEKPFHCELCGFMAVSRSHINQHKRRKHKPQV